MTEAKKTTKKTSKNNGPTLTEQLAEAKQAAAMWEGEAKRIVDDANGKLAALQGERDALARKLEAVKAVVGL